jgi:hypothetical protein
LRAACDLVQLQRGRGREHGALKLLRSVYGQFTEGFCTQDLINAKALIDTAPAPGKRGGKVQMTPASAAANKGVERSRSNNPRVRH